MSKRRCLWEWSTAWRLLDCGKHVRYQESSVKLSSAQGWWLKPKLLQASIRNRTCLTATLNLSTCCLAIINKKPWRSNTFSRKLSVKYASYQLFSKAPRSQCIVHVVSCSRNTQCSGVPANLSIKNVRFVLFEVIGKEVL